MALWHIVCRIWDSHFNNPSVRRHLGAFGIYLIAYGSGKIILEDKVGFVCAVSSCGS